MVVCRNYGTSPPQYIFERHMRVVIGSDHAGFEMKSALKTYLSGARYEVIDLGTDSEESVDYPDFAAKVADAVASERAERGILICGSGIGMSIAANRNPAIRAALCHDPELARLARQHNDANVLVLAGRFTPLETAKACIEAFMETPFEGGRHARRVAKMSG